MLKKSIADYYAFLAYKPRKTNHHTKQKKFLFPETVFILKTKASILVFFKLFDDDNDTVFI
jgi:hypothetical protein